MIGHNRLLVAQDDGHTVSMMERTYAAWIKGAKPEDIEQIKAAMAVPTDSICLLNSRRIPERSSVGEIVRLVLRAVLGNCS